VCYCCQYCSAGIVDHLLCQRVEVPRGQSRDASCNCSMQSHEYDNVVEIGSYFRTDSDLRHQLRQGLEVLSMLVQVRHTTVDIPQVGIMLVAAYAFPAGMAACELRKTLMRRLLMHDSFLAALQDLAVHHLLGACVR